MLRNLPDQVKLKDMLHEAVLVLCKTALNYETSFSVHGLLGITVDTSDIFLVNIAVGHKKDDQADASAPQVEDPQTVSAEPHMGQSKIECNQSAEPTPHMGLSKIECTLLTEPTPQPFQHSLAGVPQEAKKQAGRGRAQSMLAQQQMPSPQPRMSSPRGMMASPRVRMASPRQRMASPSQRIASPRQRTASPRQRMASPQQRLVNTNISAPFSYPAHSPVHRMDTAIRQPVGSQFAKQVQPLTADMQDARQAWYQEMNRLSQAGSGKTIQSSGQWPNPMGNQGNTAQTWGYPIPSAPSPLPKANRSKLPKIARADYTSIVSVGDGPEEVKNQSMSVDQCKDEVPYSEEIPMPSPKRKRSAQKKSPASAGVANSTSTPTSTGRGKKSKIDTSPDSSDPDYTPSPETADMNDPDYSPSKKPKKGSIPVSQSPAGSITSKRGRKQTNLMKKYQNSLKELEGGTLKCDICGQGFSNKKAMSSHMRFKHKNHQFGDLKMNPDELLSQYTCGICRQEFHEESNLLHHMNSQHKEILKKSP